MTLRKKEKRFKISKFHIKECKKGIDIYKHDENKTKKKKANKQESIYLYEYTYTYIEALNNCLCTLKSALYSFFTIY